MPEFLGVAERVAWDRSLVAARAVTWANSPERWALIEAGAGPDATEAAQDALLSALAETDPAQALSLLRHFEDEAA